VTALDGRLYVAGGITTSGTSDAVYTYNPATDSVRRIGTLPTPNAYAPLVAMDGSLYLIGGDGSRTILRIARNGRVAVAGRLPDVLANAAAVTIGDAIYVFGGDGSSAILRLTPAST
jgi:N-acetylneuraminic acid mutarotase